MMDRSTSHWGDDVDAALDAELVVLSQNGDLAAFNKLAARCSSHLYRFVRRMLGNTEDARDLCQEALTKAYLNIARLRDPAKFQPWLHHIALNLCRDWHRSARSRARIESYEEGQPAEMEWLDALPAREAPDAAVERSQMSEILHRALERLPWEQRTAIVLREYQGFTSEEIAQITGVPAATVRTRIFYGLRSVRKMMAESGIRPESLLGGGR